MGRSIKSLDMPLNRGCSWERKASWQPGGCTISGASLSTRKEPGTEYYHSAIRIKTSPTPLCPGLPRPRVALKPPLWSKHKKICNGEDPFIWDFLACLVKPEVRFAHLLEDFCRVSKCAFSFGTSPSSLQVNRRF